MASPRIAFLGAGSMTRTHIKSLLACGAQVVGICSRGESAEQAAKQAEGARAFHDFDQMLAETSPDALYICLPPGVHEGQLERAAEKGIHIFAEKPICLDLDQGRRMVEAVERAGVISQVGYHMRFAQPVEQLKTRLEDGTAGRPTMMRGAYLCNARHGDWWRDPTLGGGQVREQAIHLFDMARHLLGRPVSVSGFAEKLCHEDDDYRVEDTAAAIIRFESGAVASLVASNCAVPKRWDSPFEVICGRMVADFLSPTQATFTMTHGEPSESWWSRKADPAVEVMKDDGDVYLRETEHFLAAMRGEESPRIPLREGLEGLELVTAVMTSARDGGRVVSL